jgi:hypothetical protein
MARVKTFVNGGSLLPGDLNSIQDDYETAFSTYKSGTIERFASSAAAPVAGTYVLHGGTGAGQLAVVPVTLANYRPFYIDPADFTAGSRTNKLRLRAQLFTNAVAPATNWTVGLYPVATYGGASGAEPTIATLGAVVAGSTIAFNAPGVTSQSQGNSGDFTAPAAGYYVFAVVNSGAAAAGAVVGVRSVLQVRQV